MSKTVYIKYRKEFSSFYLAFKSLKFAKNFCDEENVKLNLINRKELRTKMRQNGYKFSGSCYIKTKIIWKSHAREGNCLNFLRTRIPNYIEYGILIKEIS